MANPKAEFAAAQTQKPTDKKKPHTRRKNLYGVRISMDRRVLSGKATNSALLIQNSLA